MLDSMGRAPRIDVEGGWHHVMNRGAGRQPIFHLAADGERFLQLVGEGCQLSGVRIGAYCLMRNHYHLLVHCPQAGLSSFMHRIGSMYTRHLNARLGRDGPILRGRFHSLLVDTDEYLAAAGRYIHRNPLDVRPAVPLDEYPWSSYRYFVSPVPGPWWLTTAELLEGFATEARYRAFVEEDDPACVPVHWAIDVALAELGDDAGVARSHARRTVLLAMLDHADDPDARRIEAAAALPPGPPGQKAMARMRSRLATEPVLARAAGRALALLTGSCQAPSGCA